MKINLKNYKKIILIFFFFFNCIEQCIYFKFSIKKKKFIYFFFFPKQLFFLKLSVINIQKGHVKNTSHCLKANKKVRIKY